LQSRVTYLFTAETILLENNVLDKVMFSFPAPDHSDRWSGMGHSDQKGEMFVTAAQKTDGLVVARKVVKPKIRLLSSYFLSME
jgi:hypothetical protein